MYDIFDRINFKYPFDLKETVLWWNYKHFGAIEAVQKLIEDTLPFCTSESYNDYDIRMIYHYKWLIEHIKKEMAGEKDNTPMPPPGYLGKDGKWVTPNGRY